VLFVGVRCPIEIIMERRAASEAGRGYVTGCSDDPVPLPVRLWQEAVHQPGIYDLEVDTSVLGPQQCADAIRQRLIRDGERPSAIERLAQAAN
jgi:chloramphenicol 3-O phosphotransferase